MGVEQELVARRSSRRGVWVIAWLLGCGPATVVTGGGQGQSGSETGTGAAATHDATAGAEGSDGGGTSTATDASTATTASADDTTVASTLGGHDFLVPPDLGAGVDDCDPWAQDCPLGEKCAWYGSDGAWAAARCVPIAPQPRAVGDACTIDGDATGGFDDCVRGAMCIAQDGLVGECVALCRGSEGAPWCSDVCSPCLGIDALRLCTPMCDPLAPACPPEAACRGDAAAFTCRTHSNVVASQGDPCALDDDCEGGQRCVPAALLPECAATGCCAPYCDLDADDPCDVAQTGTQCVAEFEPGLVPDCTSMRRLGVCRLPR